MNWVIQKWKWWGKSWAITLRWSKKNSGNLMKNTLQMVFFCVTMWKKIQGRTQIVCVPIPSHPIYLLYIKLLPDSSIEVKWPLPPRLLAFGLPVGRSTLAFLGDAHIDWPNVTIHQQGFGEFQRLINGHCTDPIYGLQPGISCVIFPCAAWLFCYIYIYYTIILIYYNYIIICRVYIKLYYMYTVNMYM